MEGGDGGAPLPWGGDDPSEGSGGGGLPLDAGDSGGRSRLYRSQILQVNMRLKALAEIYTIYSNTPLHSSTITFLLKFARICKKT